MKEPTEEMRRARGGASLGKFHDQEVESWEARMNEHVCERSKERQNGKAWSDSEGSTDRSQAGRAATDSIARSAFQNDLRSHRRYTVGIRDLSEDKKEEARVENPRVDAM
jgi:hypothetical protein